jgi:hypothetical protein
LNTATRAVSAVLLVTPTEGAGTDADRC